MAKLVLRLFGGLSMLFGIFVIANGFVVASSEQFQNTTPSIIILTALSIGGFFLLLGAPLVGFARVISLLESIDRKTRDLPAGY